MRLRHAAKLRDRLNRKLAETIFLAAQRDLVTGELDRPRAVPILANVIAVAVLASPVLIFALGATILWLGWPGLGTILIGGTLMALGVALRPRRRRIDGRIHRRADLPRTFALFDAVAARLGTDAPTGLVLDHDFNAAFRQTGAERVVVIGAILWRAAPPDERIALLSHELAHQLNRDPARSGLTSRALEVLAGWVWYLEPDADEVLVELLMYIPFLIASGTFGLLLRLVFAESQRAEYLADAISARASGSTPAKRLLERVSFSERIDAEILGLYPRTAAGGLAMIDRLANAVVDVPEDTRAEITARMRDQTWSLDATHPPTAYRLAFLDLLPETADPLALSPDDMASVDDELAPHFATLGDRLRNQLIDD